MRVTRLYLRNYRVYEGPLDLEIPPGLVGIYGANGSGKSYLVESIRWTLYGKSRTSVDEVRTSGINADCVTEVEFEHEGHLYLVRRTISGPASTVKAEAHADGLQVSEGVRDTGRYVHSVLGMDDAAFRASVFAEQNQLAAFSQHKPAERRQLILQLLGITPLDSARDLARKDARTSQQGFERLRSVLPDLERLRTEAADADVAAAAFEQQAVEDEAAEAAAKADLEAGLRAVSQADELRQEHERLVAEGRAFRAEHDRATAEVGKLTAEVADLDRAAARLAELSAEAEGWREAEARLRLVEAVVAAQAALAALPDPRPLVPPDEPAVEAARAQAEAARTVVATVQAGLEAAMAERDRARLAVERSSHLTGEADCPLCGQALGDAFKAVQASRAEELLAIEGRVTDLEVDRRQAGRAATAAAEKATAAARALKLAQAAWADHERLAARRADAVEALVSAQAVLGESSRSGHAGQPLDQGEPARLAQEVERRRRAADECQRISGRLERRGVAAAELDVEQAKVDESKGRLEALREKVASLAYRPQQLTAARAESDRLREAADVAVERAQAKRVLAGQARTGAEAAARRMADADVQHSQLVVLGDEARHLGRLADLLNAFRNTLVATVGPRLSAQAAELFAELTDSEYDLLKVDPDTYEIKVCDAGAEYGMGRFSGSETDLANLALRVAVSEHVRFQSGGAVGLLVLDEVFGPLDDDRKGRMLLALERLRARFRQVLVVTHDAAIKEQLPNAIEVLKLPGRRATARVITG